MLGVAGLEPAQADGLEVASAAIEEGVGEVAVKELARLPRPRRASTGGRRSAGPLTVGGSCSCHQSWRPATRWPLGCGPAGLTPSATRRRWMTRSARVSHSRRRACAAVRVLEARDDARAPASPAAPRASSRARPRRSGCVCLVGRRAGVARRRSAARSAAARAMSAAGGESERSARVVDELAHEVAEVVESPCRPRCPLRRRGCR